MNKQNKNKNGTFSHPVSNSDWFKNRGVRFILILADTAQRFQENLQITANGGFSMSKEKPHKMHHNVCQRSSRGSTLLCCRSHTIFLILGFLKLLVLRCFWTWLAEPCRVRPLAARPVVGDRSTFSLSIPAQSKNIHA